jgi:CubicO group peptidase (beta-lactamase class C family)
MTSGVAFQENYLDPTSDIAVLAGLTLGQDPGGSVSAVKRFNTRVAPPGQRFSYASAESLVLGLVLAGATRRNVSDYTKEKLWTPLGADADAAWVIDSEAKLVLVQTAVREGSDSEGDQELFALWSALSSQLR